MFAINSAVVFMEHATNANALGGDFDYNYCYY